MNVVCMTSCRSVNNMFTFHTNKRHMKPRIAGSIALAMLSFIMQQLVAQPIDRKALVRRHTIQVTAADSLASLSVGNGGFAFTADVTGLQSFPDEYAAGVPLVTQSQWGWHCFPNTEHYRLDESLRNYFFNGKQRPYAVQWKKPDRARAAADYWRENPHRISLANIGFDISKTDGSPATLMDIREIRQTLDMWTGCLHSYFRVEGQPVEVLTYCHPQQDAISVRVRSPLLAEKRLHIRIRLSYPSGEWGDNGDHWTKKEAHRSFLIRTSTHSALLEHILDTTRYYIAIAWSSATIKETGKHYYLIEPSPADSFACTMRFDPRKNGAPVPDFAATAAASARQWEKFWQKGGAVDFSGSKDPRAFELERRIVSSLYLTRIQCAGNQPPQETGLTGDSWYGRPHLEMHWWHGAHFPLWGRPDLLEKSLDWYRRTADIAKGIARRQGYEGLRWQKMTDHLGSETPSSVGAFLIWQQPHFIYLAELCYRAHPDKKILEKCKDLVFATADFMADYAAWDSVKGRYMLGKGLIPAQECYKPEDTYNPAFELAYWYWALATAERWRRRLGLPPTSKWTEVRTKLSPLPRQGHRYLFAESAPGSYTDPVYRTDHPSVLCALGFLPQVPMTDTSVMHATFDWIWDHWTWQHTWGWDFPMVAMTATRLGLPEKALDALLMPVTKNTWLANGHNYQDGRLRLYLPGNGGLLSAIALMCAGYEGSGPLPGFPKDGRWKVRYEGLNKMP